MCIARVFVEWLLLECVTNVFARVCDKCVLPGYVKNVYC